MKKEVLIFSTVLLIFAATGCARRVVVQPAPPARVEVIPVSPSPRHVWVKGHYILRHHRYVWVPGHYVTRGRRR